MGSGKLATELASPSLILRPSFSLVSFDNFRVRYHLHVWMMQRNFFFFVFCLFRAAPVAYGGSQARGLIRAVAAGLCQRHSNSGSEPSLQPTPQLMATPDPYPTEQGQGWIPQSHGSYSDSLTTAPRRELLPYYSYFIIYKFF